MNDEKVHYYCLIVSGLNLYSGFMTQEQAWNLAKAQAPSTCYTFEEKEHMVQYMEILKRSLYETKN